MELTIDLKRAQDIGIKREVVMSYIEKNPGTTQRQMSKEVCISTRTLFDIVDDLVSRNMVEKAGWYLYSK